jgi:hypothetical protein
VPCDPRRCRRTTWRMSAHPSCGRSALS